MPDKANEPEKPKLPPRVWSTDKRPSERAAQF